MAPRSGGSEDIVARMTIYARIAKKRQEELIRKYNDEVCIVEDICVF
jgi:hypothetical protein